MRDFAASDVSAYTVAGQTTVTSSGVDCAGYDGVMFFILPGTIDATGTVSAKCQQSSDDGSADAYADLTGATLAWTAADDNKLGVIQVEKPREKWVNCVVTRATANSVLNPIIAVRYKARGPQPVPAAQAAEQGHTVVVSPAAS